MNVFDIFDMFRDTIWGPLCGLVGIIATILIPFIILKKTQRYEKKLVDETYLNEKPAPTIRLFAAMDEEEINAERERWYFVFPGKEGDGVIYPFLILFGNTGAIKIKEPVITLQIPKDMMLEEQLESEFKTMFPSKQLAVEQVIESHGDSTFLHVSFPDVNPGSCFKLIIPMFMRLTESSRQINIGTLEENWLITGKVKGKWSRIIDLQFSGANIKPYHRQVSIATIQGRTLNEAIEEFQHAWRRYKNERRPNSLTMFFRNLNRRDYKNIYHTFVWFRINKYHPPQKERPFELYEMKLSDDISIGQHLIYFDVEDILQHVKPTTIFRLIEYDGVYPSK